MKIYIVENDYCISGIFKSYEKALEFANTCTTSGTTIRTIEREEKK